MNITPKEPGRSTARKLFFFLLKGLVTVGVISFIIHRLGWHAILSTVREADVRWFVGGAAVFLVSGLLGARQWQLLLASRSVVIPFRDAFRLYFIGMFFNNAVLGIVAGDAVKVAYLRIREQKLKEGFAATFLDRFAGLFAMILYACVGSAFYLRHKGFGEGRMGMGMLVLGGALFAFLFLISFLVSRRTQRLVFRVLDLIPLPGRARLTGLLKLVVFEAHHRTLVVRVGFYSAGIQLLRILVHVCCAGALGMLSSGTVHYFFIFVPFLAVVMMVPLPFGVREGIEGTLFAAAGFEPESAVVMGFCATLVSIVVSLAGGALFLLSQNERRTETVQ